MTGKEQMNHGPSPSAWETCQLWAESVSLRRTVRLGQTDATSVVKLVGIRDCSPD